MVGSEADGERIDTQNRRLSTHPMDILLYGAGGKHKFRR